MCRRAFSRLFGAWRMEKLTHWFTANRWVGPGDPSVSNPCPCGSGTKQKRERAFTFEDVGLEMKKWWR